MEEDGPLPIAVIGIGCRLPGDANTPEAFWSMIVEGRDAWSEVPRSRFNADAFHHPSPEAQGCFNHRGGHFVRHNIAAFDVEFFGIPPMEAKAIDPQQRLLLETTYEAVESAGISLNDFKGTHTAVYAASFANDYERMLFKDPNDLTRYHLIGTGNATFANRVSYAFDLKGASVTLDTGCSGSLVAVHQACQSLRAHETSLALAGGAVLMLSPDQMIAMSQQYILNDEGRCFTFDDRGAGYGRGEGAAMVLLKRLPDALRDGDRIRAVIRNTAVNQDGRTNGLTLPSQSAQEHLIHIAFQQLDFTPQDVDYVEAHGTGTPAGDIAEIRAIHSMYCSHRSSEQDLLIGSVKQNIGHLESASGVVGLVKTILAMENDVIPPNILFQNPKLGLLLERRGLRIPVTPEPWPAMSTCKRAVVNNFGYGGTNAIAILENYRHARILDSRLDSNMSANGSADAFQEERWRIFQFSAHSKISLNKQLAAMHSWLLEQKYPKLDAIAYTLSRRSKLNYRRAVVASSVASLSEGLLKVLERPSIPASLRIIFVFTGQGAQWPKMAKDLMLNTEFARSIQRSDELLRSVGSPWALMQELVLDEQSSRIHQSNIAQPVTTALQIAIIDTLRTWNIHPYAVVGHSSGEIAAAYAAGQISHESALAIAYHRGALFDHTVEGTTNCGGMLAVGLGEQDMTRYIAKLGLSSNLCVACINSPRSTTVSGSRKALCALKADLDAGDVFCRQLHVEQAYHSNEMKAFAPEYLARMAQIMPSCENSSCLFYSTVEADLKTQKFGPDYWATNLVSVVRFRDTIAKLSQDIGHNTHLNFVEIGPHSALQGPLRETLFDTSLSKSWSYTATLNRREHGMKSLFGAVAQLFECGHKIEHNEMSNPDAQATLLTELPTYQWDHSREFWHEPRLSRDYRHRDRLPHELLGLQILTSPEDSPSWRVLIRHESIPWLADHIIDGFKVFPATAYLAMATEAMRQWKPLANVPSYKFNARDIRFKRALRVTEQAELVLTFRERTPLWAEFRILSISDSHWHEHCSGQIQLPSSERVRDDRDELEESMKTADLRSKLEALQAVCMERLNGTQVYERMASRGNEYGPCFSLLQEIKYSGTQAVAKVYDMSELPNSRIHPTFSDAILQVAVFLHSCLGSFGSVMPINFTQYREFINDTSFVHQEVIVMCEIEKETTRSSFFKIAAFTVDELKKSIPLLECHGELVATGEEERDVLKVPKDAVFRMVWDIDPLHITTQDLESLPRGALLDVRIQEVKLFRLLDAADYFINKALRDVNDIDSVEPYLSVIRKLSRSNNLPERSARIQNDDMVLKSISELGVEGELLSRVGPALSSILSGRTDALTLLLENQLLYRVYQDDCTKRCNVYLSKYVQHLIFKDPSMRILEIGAGTGGSTIPLFEALSPNNMPFSECYDFTDVSSGFFEQAKTSLARWQPLLDMKVLDIEQDPATQGFEGSSYDLIIASNALHATRSIANTLSHAHKLLKPGGTIALIELTHTNRFYDMTFGLLPGWWSSIEEDRRDGPLLSVEQWDERLRKAAFTGVEISAFDFPGSAQRIAFMTSRAKAEPTPNGHHIYQFKVVNTLREDHPAQNIVTSLCEELGKQGLHAQVGLLDEEDTGQNRSYIILDCHDRPLLANCTDEQFRQITKIISTASSIFWATLPGFEPVATDPGGGLISGFSRTARSEREVLSFVTIDVQDCPTTRHDRNGALIASLITSVTRTEQLDKECDYEYRIVEGRVLLPRLVRSQTLNRLTLEPSQGGVEPHQTLFHASDRNLQLQIGIPGLLNSLHFVDAEKFPPLGEDELEIEVRACGVNFKDLWISLGQMKATDRFVGECSGIICAVGQNNRSRFSIGDRVCAISATPYTSKARTAADLVCHICEGISFTDAVSTPVAFCTAYYSLVEVARLERGQRVLIHSGSGALGQAAIQIAQHIGAEIFVTAGSEAKRNRISEEFKIVEDHVLSSQSTAFKENILRMTGGMGVDVALNSLSEELLHATWECVAELGTFVEVGKMDIRDNAQLDMKHFDKSITFTSIDMILLANRRPKTVQRVLKAVISMFEREIIKPVSPITTMPISKAEDAFRMMQGRKHTGKLVLEAGLQAAVPTKPRREHLRSDATYIIVGGLGNVGLKICVHMCALGAGNVVLLTRRSLPEDEVARLQQSFGTHASRVQVMCCDVTSLDDVKTIALSIESTMLPLRGIVHGPMVLQDRNLNHMTLDDFNASMSPKYHGTRNLIEVFRDFELDFLVLQSSLSGIVGIPGQGNYAAGNAYQDLLVQNKVFPRWKRCTSLDMSILTDTHMLSRKRQSKLQRRGMLPITIDSVLPYLDYAMGVGYFDDRSIRSTTTEAKKFEQLVIGLDMRAVSEDNRALYSTNAMFRHLFVTSNPKDSIITQISASQTAIEKLTSSTPQICQNFKEVMIDAIQEKVAVLLAMDQDKISAGTPVASFGLDSLIAIELKNWITKVLRVPMQTSDILDSMSIRCLADLIMERIKDNAPADVQEEARQGKTQPRIGDLASFPEVEVMPQPTNIDVPKLPLRPLESIIASFYHAVEVFGADSELTTLRRAAGRLRESGGVGRKLQARLQSLADEVGRNCWLSEIYNQTFWLQRRSPLRPAMNFFLTLPLTERQYSQEDKAALISLAAFEFKRNLVDGKIAQDTVNGEIQCMQSLQWIFNCNRRPGAASDETLRFPNNDYVVAMRKGHVYKIPLLDQGMIISRQRLSAIFRKIIYLESVETCWASVLTTENRGEWAKLRLHAIEMDANNGQFFETIEQGLFVVCLDDAAPESSEERVKQFLLDNNSNRWNDKTLSIIVCRNGVSAFWCEHSMIDGTTLDQLSTFVARAMGNDEMISTAENMEVVEGRDYTYHLFQTSPIIDTRISAIRQQHLDSIKGIDFATFQIPFGEDFFRKHTLPPKSSIQAVISLAVRQHFGHNPPSYEAVSLRSFHLGRMDIYQIHTSEMESFVSAACGKGTSTQHSDIRKLLQIAVHTHAAGITHTSRGRGWDRQLTALRYVLEDGEKEPEIFTNPIFLRTRPRKVFVSFSSTGMPEWGSVWRDKEALWIGIEVFADRSKFCISNGQGRAKGFATLVKNAAISLEGIIEGKEKLW